MPLFKEFLCLGREKLRVRGGHVQGQNPCAVGVGGRNSVWGSRSGSGVVFEGMKLCQGRFWLDFRKKF